MQFASFQTLWWIKDEDKWSICEAASEEMFLNYSFKFSLLLQCVFEIKVLRLQVKHPQDGDQDTQTHCLS